MILKLWKYLRKRKISDYKRKLYFFCEFNKWKGNSYYEFIVKYFIIKVKNVNQEFALKILQRLVAEDKFVIVNRRVAHAKGVSNEVAKVVIAQLTSDDFVKVTKDRAFPNEYLWVYETDVGIIYYIKCKFASDLSCVKFISFHPSIY